MNLNINKTYKAILSAARERRFITYGDIAKVSDVDWKNARRPMPTHLDQLVQISHTRGWPLISAIVVSKENLENGRLEGDSLAGFLAAARKIGLAVDEPQTFLREQQQAVFDWAKSAPDELEILNEDDLDAGGPRFVRYFQPVIDALRAEHGSATPDKVYEWIRNNLEVPETELHGVNKGGQSKFENKVAWARFYLAKAGFIDGATRGVWTLTAEGANTTLSHAEALRVFRQIQAQFKTADEEDEEAPPENSAGSDLFVDPARSFWFVGATWGGTDDQSPRFIREGIWQNGYHDKFTQEVARMKAGDKIAIKATYTRKYNLPFDNRGKAVSCMKIKAIGTVTENLLDGRTVKVDWETLDPPREWLFYTYRVTIIEADSSDELARRLILFSFAGQTQDYRFWTTRVPYFAKRYAGEGATEDGENPFEEELETEEEAAAPTYTVAQITGDGCFLSPGQLSQILSRIQTKKNLVLQGPPGTGKTWLAKRLAYALIGSKDPKVTRDRLRVVQFHPSLSYEDFVRGWRPAGDGTLKLTDGVFLEVVEAAKAEPDRPFVLVIEEVNRGNPAQIFGELLTILEDSKRNREDAIELAYRKDANERVYIPRNLHVIGTMNVADRSLALVDLALRRRFAFINLEPQINDIWKDWCAKRCGLAEDIVEVIERRMNALNKEIAEDRTLGPQYRIGHSYVTPLTDVYISDAKAWFREVIDTEIVPLLEEYWFDAPDKWGGAASRLREGL